MTEPRPTTRGPAMYLLRGLAWAVMMAGESGLAVLRTLMLAPVVGDFRARQVGSFSGQP